MRDSSLFPWIGRFSFERTPTKHVVHLLLYHPPSSSSCAVFHYTSKRSHRERKKWNSSYCPLASDYGYSGRHSRFIATIYNNVFFEGYAERNWHGESDLFVSINVNSETWFEFTRFMSWYTLIAGDEFNMVWVDFCNQLVWIYKSY